MDSVCVWLADRLDLQLHTYQLKTLIKIVKVRMEVWQDKRSAHSLVHTLWPTDGSWLLFLFFSFLLSAKTSFNAPTQKECELNRV